MLVAEFGRVLKNPIYKIVEKLYDKDFLVCITFEFNEIAYFR
jgi:hypothetical protein